MRDGLPKIPHKNETAIVNLDSKYDNGTHWVCYRKKENKFFIFTVLEIFYPRWSLYVILVQT